MCGLTFAATDRPLRCVAAAGEFVVPKNLQILPNDSEEVLLRCCLLLCLSRHQLPC